MTDQPNMSAIEAAILQAQKNAGAFQPNPETTQVAAAQPVYMPAAPSAPATPLSVDDMLSGSMNVKAWLKVTKFGMNLGSDLKMHTSIPVTINMDEVQYCYSVRYGNPAKYEKTYDKVTDVKGRPWVQVLQQAQQVDAKASEFRSADIPFYLRGEAIKAANGDVLCDVGEVLGHSISVTGWKYFQNFIREANRAGLNIHNGQINATLEHLYQKNDKGEWGVILFKDLAAA